MASWFDKLLGRPVGSAPASPEVQRLLALAQEHRSGIVLVERLGRAPIAMSTTIEQVREQDIIVSRPTVGGRLRPLATHAPLSMLIDLSEQQLVAETESLGRIKIPSGGGGTFYGYRLAVPARIDVVEPESPPVLQTEEGLMIEADLTLIDRPNPVRGTIKELSSTGMVLRCRNARDTLDRGRKAHLKVRLPDPVGQLAERVSIVSTVDDDETGLTTVEIVFERRIDTIADLLRHGGQRSLRHRQAG